LEIKMRAAKLITAALLGMALSTSAALAQDRGTPDEAKALSDKAAAHMRASGAEKAIADFESPGGGFRDRDLFVVVYRKDGKVISSPGVPAVIGRDANTFKDIDGKEFGKELLAANGSWVEYRMTNPTTKKVEQKASWVNQVGDYSVFVGAYKQ
jgi:signal transduction histidine kinase